MKKKLALVALLPLLAALVVIYRGTAGRTQAQEGGSREAQLVYFGFLLGTPRVGAVAFDFGATDAQGQRLVRAYVCDGLGPPDGMAIWFRSTMDAQVLTSGDPFSLTSVAGGESLLITAMNERGVYGAFTDATGVTSHFVAYTAFDGAGIYQVTLDESLHYAGTSTQGAVLDAQATPDGTTTGSITLPNGKAIDFKVRSLALASPADLAAHGLPQDFPRFVADNQVPGEYVAVIAPGGSHWFGRSGFVTSGSPGAQIIGLDKKEVR